MQETVFDKIVNRQIPASIVYEDNNFIAFKDINPVAKVHVVLIPKVKDNLNKLSNAEEKNTEILGQLMVTVAKVAKKLNLDEGYRIVINDGTHGGQTVDYLHVHIIGGQQLYWPPGTGNPEDIKHQLSLQL